MHTDEPYAGLDAAPFIEIVVAAGRPTLSAADRRVYLAGARVTSKTKAQVDAWMMYHDVSRGMLLDLLVQFAAHRNFALPLKKRAGAASTPPPARHPSLRPDAKVKARPVKLKPAK